MGLAEVGALIEADNRARVQAETWGHLAPALGRRYPVRVTFVHGEYGDLAVLRMESGELDGGPWLYDDVHDWLCDQATERGEVYQFAGFYQKGRRRYRFVGKVERAAVVARIEG